MRVYIVICHHKKEEHRTIIEVRSDKMVKKLDIKADKGDWHTIEKYDVVDMEG